MASTSKPPPTKLAPNPRPPTAKRSPSILVTDARSNSARPAPFAGASGRRLHSGSGSSATGPGPRPSPSRFSVSGAKSAIVGAIQSKSSSSAANKPANGSSPSQPPLAQPLDRGQPYYKPNSHSRLLKGYMSSNGKFGKISIDKILSDVSEIPSSQQRVPSGFAQHRSYHNPLESSSAISSHPRSQPTTRSPYSSGPRPSSNYQPKPGAHAYKPTHTVRKAIPPRLTQNLPPRTTKVSEKLVLIPESLQPEFKFEDDETGSDDSPPLEDTRVFQNRKSYAERLPKERRAEKFPRVTAYCISENIRIGAAATFLRENHKIRPRLYNEALYAPYYLPLLPGDDENRVKSSPGGILIMEQMINQSEQLDHHYEYYSGLEGSKNQGQEEFGLQNGTDRARVDALADFDPSEPQDFSPPSKFLESRIEQATQQWDKGSASVECENASNGPKPSGFGNESMSKENVDQNASKYQSITSSNLDTSIPQSNTNLNQNPAETNTFHSKGLGDKNKANDNSKAANPSIAPRSVDPIISKKSLDAANTLNHAEIFIFTYGVIVFWNFTEHQEKQILADLTFARVAEVITSAKPIGGDGKEDELSAIENILIPKPLITRPMPHESIEMEELNFTYSPNTVKPRIYNDMITLRSGDHMIKLAMSHALAQSTKLSRFEARMDDNMHDVRYVPKTLALTGQLGLKREELLKISGKLFKLRVDVNLSSNVLDTPDFFWEDEPSLNPLYTAVREYLEIEPRILVLNERCKVFLELTEMLADSLAEYNMSRITWIVIILITLSLVVSVLEIAERCWIIRDKVR